MKVQDQICAEIQKIMRDYREQETSRYGVSSPGGLEHMGDVWRLFHRWDEMIGDLTPAIHYHVAKYVDDKLTDECAECGRDLRDSVHRREAQP